MHKAIQVFGWYPDGYTREQLAIGDVRDFGNNALSLLSAKMIAEVEKVVVVTKSTIAAQETPTEMVEVVETEKQNAKPRRQK